MNFRETQYSSLFLYAYNIFRIMNKKIYNISWLGIRNWNMQNKCVLSCIFPRGASITLALSKFKNCIWPCTQRGQPYPSHAIAIEIPVSTFNIIFQKRVWIFKYYVTACLRPRNSAPITQNITEYQALKLEELWLTGLIIQVPVPFHLSMKKKAYLCSIFSVQLESPLLCR